MASRTSINASDMSMEALFSVVSNWDMTVPIFVAYNSPIAPDNNNCVGLASRNYIELWSVSGRHYQLVQGQSDTWIDITSDCGWKTYHSVEQLGLDKSCNTSRIIDKLVEKGNAMLIVPMFHSEYPNINWGGDGARHLYTVKCAVSGYVSVLDEDISNGLLYYCGHDGSYFSAWSSTAKIL